MPWWRRKGSGDKIWIMGDVDIRADDVVFVDRASQDLRYDPPAVEIGAQLERDLALHRPFVEALADDKFATVAHHMLAHLEWMRTGTREIGLFEGLHHMFACLRNKGEDYLDFKFGDYPGVAPTKAEAAQHVLRMKEMMRSLGWRTYTADELQARVREDFRARLERRLEAWRQLDAYEARPASSHDVLAKTPLISDMLLYEGDDPEWLAELRGEERLAASAQFVQRLKNLANSGRPPNCGSQEKMSAFGTKRRFSNVCFSAASGAKRTWRLMSARPSRLAALDASRTIAPRAGRAFAKIGG